ncbi:MAG: VOC family protein [Rhodoblastus sp.]|nr:MAG: VOC family protein [Rhodoblastus sp.]
MFSHVTLGADDLDAAGRFYDALLTPLGLERREVKPDGGAVGLCWRRPGERRPWFFVFRPFDGRPAGAGNGTMVAFLAPSEEAVRRSYAAAMAAGGRCEGPPGERPHYAPGYYGAYLRDPQGNKAHVVYRGDLAAAG